jgi:hypothetical protein
MNKVWGKDTKLTFIKRRVSSFFSVIYFLARGRSKIIEFDIPSAVLMENSAIDISEIVSYYITLAEHTDLSQYDELIMSGENDLFWTMSPTRYSTELRTILKLGWIINEIRTNGVNNSLQILQSSNGKYICHPGTSRLLVVTYICPQPTVKGFYIWNKELDPNPFILSYPHKELKNPIKILSLYKKKSNQFKIRFFKITEKDKAQSYTKLAVTELLKFNKTFSLDFITMFDNGHWDNDIKGKLTFSQIISFDQGKCTFGGIPFVKHNNKWIPYERFTNISQDYRDL